MQPARFLTGLFTGVFLTLLVVATIVIFLATQPNLPPLAESPIGGDLVVTVSEGYLNRVAGAVMDAEDDYITAVTIDVQPGSRVKIIARGEVALAGTSLGLDIHILGSIAVREERLVFAVDRLEFVGLPIPLNLLPESLRQSVAGLEDSVNQELNALVSDLDLVPLGVATDDASLVISLQG